MDGGHAADMASQTLSLAAPSTTSSTVSPVSGYSRTSYRRDGSAGLRSFSSLQDFSPYRTYPATAFEASVYQDSADSLEKGLAPVQAGRGPAFPPYVFKGGICKSGSATNVLSPIVLTPGSSAWCSRGYMLLFISLLLCLLILLAYRWNFYSVTSEHLQFAIVVDCGSTGTRIHVYGWARSMTPGKQSLPVMLRPEMHESQQRQGRAYNRMETEPGLDKLFNNESGVRAALEPLLHWASKRIPASAHGSTPIFVLATAGLRRLPSIESKWVLDKVWSVLESSPFLCRRKWVRIISGVEEASYGWIALNYNQDRLGHASGLPTFGALDLGGSSLEVTFQPDEIPQGKYGVNLSVGAAEHRLYAYSHEGFGLNDAFQKSVATLFRRLKGNSDELSSNSRGLIEVKHPCLHAGYRQPFVSSSLHFVADTISGPVRAEGEQVELIGDPNWEACADLANSILDPPALAEAPAGCEKSPCALGKYQPQPQGKFYALAGFFVVYKFFGLKSDASLEELLQKARQYCMLPWEVAHGSVEPQPSIEQYCFRAPYVVALLRNGLHLSDTQIVIDSGGFAWTLGAALLEAGALGSNRDGNSYEGQLEVPFVLDSLSLKGVVLLGLMLSILVIFIAIRCTRPWILRLCRRSCLPLFIFSPGNQNGCLPKSFGLIFSPTGSGEGRVKLPGSPAPGSSVQSFQQDHQSESHSSLDSDVLQKLDTAGLASTGSSTVGRIRHASSKLPGSYLQSRRTQSREDLSSCDFDSHTNKV